MAKRQKTNVKNENNERTDRLEFEGEVLESLPAAMFKVKMLNSSTTIMCVLSGKVRQNKIRILPGDKVVVEVSPYDLTRGRIMWRKTEKHVPVEGNE